MFKKLLAQLGLYTVADRFAAFKREYEEKVQELHAIIEHAEEEKRRIQFRIDNLNVEVTLEKLAHDAVDSIKMEAERLRTKFLSFFN